MCVCVCLGEIRRHHSRSSSFELVECGIEEEEGEATAAEVRQHTDREEESGEREIGSNEDTEFRGICGEEEKEEGASSESEEVRCVCVNSGVLQILLWLHSFPSTTVAHS